MKLFRIIACAQSGRIFEAMGNGFGLSDEMAAEAVRFFLPPLRKAVERRVETMDGLLSLLDFLGSRRCDRVMNDPRMFGHDKVEAEGRRILDYLFPDRGQVARMIEKRADLLKIDAEKLEQMLPFIAVLAVGAIEQKTRRPIGAMLHRLAGGEVEERAVINPYAELAAHLKRRKAEENSGRGGMSALLGSLFGRGETRPAA
jgi:hypothetical protein